MIEYTVDEYTVKVDENGSKEWYLNGLLHREGGPAVELADGTKVWCLNGVRYSEKEFNEKMNPAKELTVTEIEKVGGSIKIRW